MARLFVFAFDLTEASQIRRIQSFRAAGHDVVSASFRRSNMNADFVPEWTNIDLGQSENERYGKRVLAIFRALFVMMRHRDALSGSDVIVARNIDLLVIAWVSRLLCLRTRVPLVYECLDIHGLFTRTGLVGAVMRWCERRLLHRIQLLIVSSPGFIRAYFQAVQGYHGPYAILENKLWLDGVTLPRPGVRAARPNGAPIVLGWVGSIRCAPSLAILMRTADEMGEEVQIVIHGNVHRHVLLDFDDEVGRRANVTYRGPYGYPDDLAAIYGSCDLVWAQDLWQSGANSDWLLPNRIYEASWFGCPSVAVAGTETGRRIAADGLGFTLAEATAPALVALLATLDAGAIHAQGQQILETDGDRFRLKPEEIVAALGPVLPAD